ncbi:MAG: alpha/beta hydrolase, partial [Halodesulfurarchaeum sp.]|nr:alpha/beta hydrolase [Halodesulfurarchaeum sp.]
EEGVKLITPERPGFGQSSPPPNGWTWQDWQHDLTELLQGESIEKASVLGFSGGGPFALAAGRAEWASRIALVSSVIPPSRNALAKLSKIPYTLRLLFRVSEKLATIRGAESVVRQYTDQTVSETVAQQIAADFHEAFRQNAKAVARENRSFTEGVLPQEQMAVPIRAWHGAEDTNTPIESVDKFIERNEGELITTKSDHFGTLLECKQAILHWLR